MKKTVQILNSKKVDKCDFEILMNKPNRDLILSEVDRLADLAKSFLLGETVDMCDYCYEKEIYCFRHH